MGLKLQYYGEYWYCIMVQATYYVDIAYSVYLEKYHEEGKGGTHAHMHRW